MDVASFIELLLHDRLGPGGGAVLLGTAPGELAGDAARNHVVARAIAGIRAIARVR